MLTAPSYKQCMRGSIPRNMPYFSNTLISTHSIKPDQKNISSPYTDSHRAIDGIVWRENILSPYLGILCWWPLWPTSSVFMKILMMICSTICSKQHSFMIFLKLLREILSHRQRKLFHDSRQVSRWSKKVWCVNIWLPQSESSNLEVKSRKKCSTHGKNQTEVLSSLQIFSQHCLKPVSSEIALRSSQRSIILFYGKYLPTHLLPSRGY